jgi:hypothetical protein
VRSTAIVVEIVDGRCLTAVLKPRFKPAIGENWNESGAALDAITALIEASHTLSVCPRNPLVALLRRYLPNSPPRGLSARYNSTRGGRPILTESDNHASGVGNAPSIFSFYFMPKARRSFDAQGSGRLDCLQY